MQKSTLWLAFLGASLATHNEKHIAIDVLSRISPKRAQSLLAVIVGLFSAVTCFYLARVFFLAVMNNAGDIPFDMQVMDEAGASLHVCDVAQAALLDARLTRPELFCGVRAGLEALGAHVTTPDTALQLIAPAMFLVMSARFILHSVLSGMRFTGRDVGDEVTVASEETAAASGTETSGQADSEASESTGERDED